MTLDERKQNFLSASKANVEKQRAIQLELQRLYDEMAIVLAVDEQLEKEYYAIIELSNQPQ